MARRPKSGQCVYCLKHSEKRTWDHVLPLSWYPDSMPIDIEKWKVPVCHECNHKLGKVEESLLVKLGLCLDPKSIAALGISHKALRAVSPEFAKSEKDRIAREKKKIKLLKEMVHFDRLPEEGLFPNFGPEPGLIYHGYHAVLIPEEQLHQYAEKLVRGMTYVLDEKLLNEKYQIELQVVNIPKEDRLLQIFRKYFEIHHRGLGFVVKRLIREDDQAWIYEFKIWQKLVFYVVVSPPIAEK